MSDDPNEFGGPGAGGFGRPQGGQPQGGQPQGGFGQPQGGFQQPAGPPAGEYGGPPSGHGGAPLGAHPPGAPGYGGAGPQGGPPYGGPPSGGDGYPKGWKVAAIVLLVLGPALSAIGMIPCLGLLNWLAIPTNVALAIVGALGLTIGPKLADGKAADFSLHVAAVVVGILLALASVVRCLIGGGLA